MTRFIVKQMALPEWTAFQDRLEPIFIQQGAPDHLSLFHENTHDEDRLLMPLEALAIANLLSPGGWAEVHDLAGSSWSLLIGRDGAHKVLGVPAPKIG